MAGAIIGALRVVLGIDTATFDSGLSDAQRKLKAAGDRMQAIGGGMMKVGATMSAAVTAPLIAMGKAAMDGAQSQRMAMAQVEAALKSMGPVAGRTAEQLLAASDALELNSLHDGDEILKKVTANLLTFGNVAGTVFDRAQQAAVDLATRMDGDLQAAAILVGKALNDPVKGLTRLSKAGIEFSASQMAQVKAMAAAGNAAGAQAILLGELERQFGGAAKAAADTTPWRQAEVAIGQAGDVIGEALLPIIPPIANAVRDMALAFGNLSPQTQQFAIYAAGAAAAAGPLLTAIGGITFGIGALLPKLAVLLGPGGFAALGPAMAPIIVGAGAVVLAYQHWDKIGPWIDNVVARTTKAGQDLDRWFKGLNEWTEKTDKRLGIPSQSQFLDSLGANALQLERDINRALADIQRWADDTDAAIVRFGRDASNGFRLAVASAQALYQGVKTWLVDKLGGTLAWVSDKAKSVGDAFFTLYDRVVGHSYVPDMVDEIGEHMARLEGNLVKPAATATNKAAAAFAALEQKVKPILERLFPAQARDNQLRAEMKVLDEYGQMAGWTARQRDEARDRLRREAGGRDPDYAPTGIEEPPAPSAMPVEGELDALGAAIEKAAARGKAANDNLVESFAGMARDVAGSLQGLVSNIKSGDWLSALSGVLDLVSQVSGILKGTKAPAARTFSVTPKIEARATGGPVIAGQPYLVGEQGRELFTPAQSGWITPNKDLGRSGGRPIVFDARGAVMTAELLAQMEAVASASGGRLIARNNDNAAFAQSLQLGRRRA